MFLAGRRNIHLLILFLVSTVFLLTFSSVAFSQDDAIDLEMILAGIKHYDSLVKTGEGVVLYKRVKMPGLTDDGHRKVVEYYLTFTQHQTRMDIPEYHVGKVHNPKLTVIQTKSEGELHVPDSNARRNRFAYFSAPTKNFFDWQPKRIMTDWEEGSLYEHLKEKKFEIKQKEELNRVTCYVLENIAGEKIWISPEQGFNFLKYEYRFALKTTLPSRGLSRGTPLVERRRAFYKKYEDVWFPKQTFIESYFIDKNGQEQLLTKTEIETKNFRVNHDIPEATFVVEVPDTVPIWVDDLRKNLSKKEFLDVFFDLEWVK